ncbi:MAG: Smr/MutS family protein [Candidatus Nucleicultricaceae bacterium]
MTKKKDDKPGLQGDDKHVWQSFVEGISKTPSKNKKTSTGQNKSFEFKLQRLAETVLSKSLDQPQIAPTIRNLEFNEGLTRRSIRKIDPQATLDLHGHKRHHARTILKNFIHQSAARGLNCVCIITGKGLRAEERGEERMEDLLVYESGGKTTIRESLMGWLKEGDIFPLIASVTQANPHHGGGGAFYVLLKKK